MFAYKTHLFSDRDQMGSFYGYSETIPMIQWLFNAAPNNQQSWMPRLQGCAYVLQTVYNYHTQTIGVKSQEPFAMRSGGLIPRATIVAAMKELGLDNVDGPFQSGKTCDGCTMLSPKIMATLGSKCVQIPGENCCRPCRLFGRPCCSYTKNGAVRGVRAFSQGVIEGTNLNEGKVTPADVVLNKKYRAALHHQPLPETDGQVLSFSQQLIDVLNLTQLEDDLSDVEEAEEEFQGGEE